MGVEEGGLREPVYFEGSIFLDNDPRRTENLVMKVAGLMGDRVRRMNVPEKRDFVEKMVSRDDGVVGELVKAYSLEKVPYKVNPEYETWFREEILRNAFCQGGVTRHLKAEMEALDPKKLFWFAEQTLYKDTLGIREAEIGGKPAWAFQRAVLAHVFQ